MMNATRTSIQPKRFRRAGAPQLGMNGSSGNAEKYYDRYMALAREAASAGDMIEMENCYQHAEHFFRTMRS